MYGDRHRCAVPCTVGGWRQGHLRVGEKITRRSLISTTHVASDRWLLPQRGLDIHRPTIDDSPPAATQKCRVLLREKEVNISNTSGRICDMMLSLHVLARHNNNIGGSLHNSAPQQQRRENFLLRKADRMVIGRYCGVCTRGHVWMFCCQTLMLILHNHSRR